MVGSVIRPLRKFSNNNLNREVRWDRQGASPSAFSRERSEPSPLADVSHRFYDRMRRSSDTARNDADVWGKRDEAPSGGSPRRHVKSDRSS
jgi:hydrogenase small subunit